MSVGKSIAILLISYLCLAHTRSVSFIGDVRIQTGDDKFICDKIECPQNADSCVVSKRKDPKDPSVLVRSNICYSRTGEEVKKSVTTEAVNPNSQIKVLVEAYRNGGINSINTINTEEFDEEAFATQQAEFNENMDNLHRGLAEMRYRLEHMFD